MNIFHAKIKYIIGLLLLLVFSYPIAAQSYKYDCYTADNGLAQNYIYAIEQDDDGFLWIGTGNGISRFDGNHFKTFTTKNSLANNFVTCSFKDENNIWLGHMDGSINIYQNDTFKTIKTELQGKSSITNIDKDNSENIWLSSQMNGLVQINKNLFIKYYSFEKNPLPIYSFKFLNNNELIIGSLDGLYFCKINQLDKIEIIKKITKIPSTRISKIVKSLRSLNYIIVSDNKGIFNLEINLSGFQVLPIAQNISVDLSKVQSVFEDNNLDLWVATFGHGVYCLSYSQNSYSLKENYSSKNGLNCDNVKLVYKDSENNIWFSVYGKGLSKLIDPAYRYYEFDEIKYGASVCSVYIGFKYIWFGTELGLIRKSKLDNTIKFYGDLNGLPNDKITALHQINNDELWIGTEKNGIYTLNISQNKITHLHNKKGILENSINYITSKNNTLWIATKKGACSINLTNNKRKWYTMSEGGLPHNCVNHVFIDSNGYTYLSTLSSSLVKIKNDSISKLNIAPDNPFINIKSVTEDNKGVIWAGTLGNGLYKIGDTITNYTTANGLLTNYCYSILKDNYNRLWVTHRGGITRIKLDNNLMKPLQEDIGLSKNYAFNGNASCISNTGELWFGTNQGVLNFIPEIENKISLAAKLSINSVEINDKVVDFKNGISLNPGRYKINISYIGVHLKDPRLIKYRYRLTGYKNDWSSFTSDTEVVFHNITDGNFDFNLQAITGDGVLNLSPLKLSILVKTPIYKQAWFYICLLILFIGTTFWYIKLRERKLKIANRILEEKVNTRTKEIVRQKEEIENQRDLIKVKNKDITDSIRYASQIQTAIIPPLKFLQNNISDCFLINKPKDIVSGDFYWSTKVDTKLVVALADCTGHGVPGAFMSMLGVTLLNEIVMHRKILQSDQILNQLKQDIIISLRQEKKNSTSRDGMDMSLFVFDTITKELEFSGAFNSLLLLRDNSIKVLKADRMPIGIYHNGNKQFTKQEILIEPNDMVYLFTDGYPDQFGGEKDRRFTSKRFKQKIMEVHKKPIDIQKQMLENTLHSWMDGREQLDDITLLGIKF